MYFELIYPIAAVPIMVNYIILGNTLLLATRLCLSHISYIYCHNLFLIYITIIYLTRHSFIQFYKTPSYSCYYILFLFAFKVISIAFVGHYSNYSLIIFLCINTRLEGVRTIIKSFESFQL